MYKKILCIHKGLITVDCSFLVYNPGTVCAYSK